MTAAVSSDRWDRLGLDQVEPCAGNAVLPASLSRKLGPECRC